MTPTSAPGATDRAGFTLVEMLAVTAIAGLAAAAVVLTLPDAGPDLDAEAERLAARLSRARDEAVLTNRPVAVEIGAAGYGFARFDGAAWSPLDEGPFRDEAWSARTRLSGSPLRIAFDPTGASDPARVSLTRDGDRRTVAVDGAGAVSLND